MKVDDVVLCTQVIRNEMRFVWNWQKHVVLKGTLCVFAL